MFAIGQQSWLFSSRLSGTIDPELTAHADQRAVLLAAPHPSALHHTESSSSLAHRTHQRNAALGPPGRATQGRRNAPGWGRASVRRRIPIERPARPRRPRTPVDVVNLPLAHPDRPATISRPPTGCSVLGATAARGHPTATRRHCANTASWSTAIARQTPFIGPDGEPLSVRFDATCNRPPS